MYAVLLHNWRFVGLCVYVYRRGLRINRTDGQMEGVRCIVFHCVYCTGASA